jgi:hypothetical protein
MVERHPEMQAWVDSSLTGGRFYSGCTVEFFRQLAGKDLAEAWQRFPGSVLALWGAGDFLSGREDHERIARIVNAAHPGHARFLALEGVDHAFSPAASQAESFAQWSAPGRRLLPTVADALREWSESLESSAR